MAKLTWYGSPEDTHRMIVRGVPGIKAAVRSEAEGIAGTAEAILAPHHANNAAERDPGDSISHIVVESGIVDSYVDLVDEDGGAAAIEAFISPLKKAAGVAVAGG